MLSLLNKPHVRATEEFNLSADFWNLWHLLPWSVQGGQAGSGLTWAEAVQQHPLDLIWDASTYSAGDILASVSFGVTLLDETTTVVTLGTRSGGKGDGMETVEEEDGGEKGLITVEEVRSFSYGRCAVIRTDTPILTGVGFLGIEARLVVVNQSNSV